LSIYEIAIYEPVYQHELKFQCVIHSIRAERKGSMNIGSVAFRNIVKHKIHFSL